MQYSLNQIEHTARKAARGAGLSWSVAEEAGRAVRWLEQFEQPGVIHFLSVLESTSNSNQSDAEIKQQDNVWWSGDGVLSPIVVGPAICDRLDPQNLPLVLQQIASPILLVGFIGSVLVEGDQAVYLQWDGLTLQLTPNHVAILGDHSVIKVASTDEIRLDNKCIDQVANFHRLQGKIGSHFVDSDAWKKLEQLAHHTYVEATAESRLAGAGAGLNDND